MGKLDGKVAIITGAGAGIGAETARTFARYGARVAVADIDKARAEAVAQAICAAGAEAMAVQVDVSEAEQVQALVAATVKAFGGLDVLHNNAALTSPDVVKADGSVVDLDLALWHRVLAVDLTGPMLGCKYAIPEMIKRGGGAIISTSSGLGQRGAPGMTAYAAAKAGLIMLMRSVAAQYGKQGVRANTLVVGLVLTEGNLAVLGEAAAKASAAANLVPYHGEARHVAEAAAFLASGEASFITGAELPVDGGVLSRIAAIVPQETH